MVDKLLLFLAAARTLRRSLFRETRFLDRPDYDTSEAWFSLASSNLNAMRRVYFEAMAEARLLWQTDQLDTLLHPATIRRAMRAAHDGDVVLLEKEIRKMERSLDGAEAAMIRKAAPHVFADFPPVKVIFPIRRGEN